MNVRAMSRLRMIVGLLLVITASGCSGSARPSVGSAPTTKVSATLQPSSTGDGSKPIATSAQTESPTTTAPPASFESPAVLGGTLDLSGVTRTNLPLPAGAQLDVRGYLVADSDWVVVTVTLPAATPSATESVYAINIKSGARRKLLDTNMLDSGFLSLSGSQVAWASWTCSALAETLSCSSWRITVVDLDTGVSRIVAQGSDPDVAVESDQTDTALIPALALSADTLAYTSGDLKGGFRLDLLTLSSGATRTVPLGGPVEQIVWAGSDLAWVEDADFHDTAYDLDHGNSSPYYTSSRLMLLSDGATAPRHIETDGPYWLTGDAGLVVWDTGGDYMWTATTPQWQPVQSKFIADSAPFASDGWLGWASGGYGLPFLVIEPGDSVQRVVPDGVALSGGWIFLGSRPGQYGPTNLDVVPLSSISHLYDYIVW
jgi:hypothetical protein